MASGSCPPVMEPIDDDAEVYTMNFATLPSHWSMPALCQHFRELCNSTAARFQQPLPDAGGYIVGVLSLKPNEWRQPLDVTSRLAERICTDGAIGGVDPAWWPRNTVAAIHGHCGMESVSIAEAGPVPTLTEHRSEVLLQSKPRVSDLRLLREG